jgi:hypothetical protein
LDKSDKAYWQVADRPARQSDRLALNQGRLSREKKNFEVVISEAAETQAREWVNLHVSIWYVSMEKAEGFKSSRGEREKRKICGKSALIISVDEIFLTGYVIRCGICVSMRISPRRRVSSLQRQHWANILSTITRSSTLSRSLSFAGQAAASLQIHAHFWACNIPVEACASSL